MSNLSILDLSTTYIDIHTHHPPSLEKEVFQLINVFHDQLHTIDPSSTLSYSVGIHPWHVSSDIHTEPIKKRLTHPAVIAIGEIGLDHVIDVQIEFQADLFVKQIQWARHLQKPIIVHCVHAYADILYIKKRYDKERPWIIHGFNSHPDMAKQLIDMNCYLSFGHFLVTNEKTQDTFTDIPLERVFLETDESPYSIQNIYNKAAEIKQISLSQLQKQLIKNFNTLF